MRRIVSLRVCHSAWELIVLRIRRLYLRVCYVILSLRRRYLYILQRQLCRSIYYVASTVRLKIHVLYRAVCLGICQYLVVKRIPFFVLCLRVLPIARCAQLYLCRYYSPIFLPLKVLAFIRPLFSLLWQYIVVRIARVCKRKYYACSSVVYPYVGAYIVGVRRSQLRWQCLGI